MKILAFDTSTEWCTAALWLDGDIHAVEVKAGQDHSRILLPMIQRLLAEAGLTLAALDGLAFGKGPGAFTGLRIACSVIQGLAMGAGLPVVGVVTLEAMAAEVAADRVVACLDARMGELYGAVYERVPQGWVARQGPGLYRPEVMPLPEETGWVGCGNGFTAYADVLSARSHGGALAIHPEVIPHARSIARLAAQRYARGERGAAEDAQPFYVRDKVALKRSER